MLRFAALVLAVVAVVFWLSRADVLFVIVVDDGQPRVRRGKVPQGLLGQFADVLASPRVSGVTIRGIRMAGGVRLMVRGRISDGQVQQLRNVFGMFPMSRLQS